MQTQGAYGSLSTEEVAKHPWTDEGQGVIHDHMNNVDMRQRAPGPSSTYLNQGGG